MPDPDGEGKKPDPGNNNGNSNSPEISKGIAGRPSSTTARDLRVVESIESSAGSGGGIHIHIFKSRELTNARNYAKKIGSILTLHGYGVVDLTNGNSNSEKGSRGISVYIVDENYLESIRKERNLQFPVRISQLIGSSKIGQNGSADVLVALSDAYHANVFPERSESGPEVRRSTGESEKSRIKRGSKSQRNGNLPFLMFGFAVLLPFLLTTLEEYSSTFGI
ncbi:MAG TPA: hypothetical protein VKU79_03185, partial [Thermoplasmataceae archaeon]|nr:hypothetical protein [Thermoplasmataceae archaeon]